LIKAYRRTSFRYDFIRENHEKEINFSFKFVSQEGKDKKKPHFKGLNLHFEFFNIKNNDLVLGPFQGKVACMHIPSGKGVCGTCALQRCTQLVENVHTFPSHIACDSASNSEIVIPLIKENTLLGVLDVDSPILARFDTIDQHYLEQAVAILLQSL